MQSGRHKSAESNSLYVDPTVQALAHRSKVLQYDPIRDGIQEDGELVDAAIVQELTEKKKKKKKKRKSKRKKRKAPTAPLFCV